MYFLLCLYLNPSGLQLRLIDSCNKVFLFVIHCNMPIQRKSRVLDIGLSRNIHETYMVVIFCTKTSGKCNVLYIQGLVILFCQFSMYLFIDMEHVVLGRWQQKPTTTNVWWGQLTTPGQGVSILRRIAICSHKIIITLPSLSYVVQLLFLKRRN